MVEWKITFINLMDDIHVSGIFKIVDNSNSFLLEFLTLLLKPSSINTQDTIVLNMQNYSGKCP
jgi:hypothetical protein